MYDCLLLVNKHALWLNMNIHNFLFHNLSCSFILHNHLSCLNDRTSLTPWTIFLFHIHDHIWPKGHNQLFANINGHALFCMGTHYVLTYVSQMMHKFYVWPFIEYDISILIGKWSYTSYTLFPGGHNINFING